MAADVREAVSEAATALAPEALARAEALTAYIRLLERWNRAYNLSAVREPVAMARRHVGDSLSLLPWLAPGSLLDLGSGAGLPGLVIAVVQPERAVTLLDSNGKKVRFLRQAAMELGLSNVDVIQARAESAPATSGYACVTARAFTALAGFWELARPRLAAGGRVYAMKGRYPRDELAALPAEGVSSSVHRLAVPGVDGERHLVILEPSE